MVVVDVIRQVEADTQRPPAHTVYELITTSLRGRVPGAQFNARWSVTPQPGSSSKPVRSDNGSMDLYLQERGPERRRYLLNAVRSPY